MVIDGQDRLAQHAAHGAGKLLVLIQAEGQTVALGLPVGRVEEEGGVGPVVLGEADLPAEVLDGDPREPKVRLAEILLDAQQRREPWLGSQAGSVISAAGSVFQHRPAAPFLSQYWAPSPIHPVVSVPVFFL